MSEGVSEQGCSRPHNKKEIKRLHRVAPKIEGIWRWFDNHLYCLVLYPELPEVELSHLADRTTNTLTWLFISLIYDMILFTSRSTFQHVLDRIGRPM